MSAESIHGESLLVSSADDAAQRDAPAAVETWIGSLVKRARRVTWWWTRGEHDVWYRQVYTCQHSQSQVTCHFRENTCAHAHAYDARFRVLSNVSA